VLSSYHLKVVFDTNVLFGAIAKPDGHLYTWVFDQHEPKQYTIYTSEPILLELQQKLEEKLHYTRIESIAVINSLKQVCILVQPTQKVAFEPDPDDVIILECALEAGADCIYTADKELLKLKDFREIKIIHPASLKYTFYLS
jgi:putative PIN family toxin of toxin-antitoxin system